jgi:DNA-binding response OmpR family regulator
MEHKMELVVIEDNPSTLKMLNFLLEQEGYIVHAASTVAAGMAALHGQSVDLLVVDIMLPDGNGVQVCRRLRDEGWRLPILVISALGTHVDKVEAFEGGADDYMTKPFDPSEVVARVHALARRTHQAGAPALQTRLCVGVACLDVANQRIEVSGTDQVIPLTKMESQLLHVLLRNVGHVVGRDQLITEAWGADYEGSSNQLEVYVHRLRRKLRAALGDEEVIRTVPGGSYEVPARTTTAV